MKKVALFFLLITAFFWPHLPAAHAVGAAVAPMKQETLRIKTSSGEESRFIVEIARTPGQQEHGLMFRKTMPRTHGMLFLWPRDTPVSMWMKNTLMPLDMLFIDGQGRIVYLARHTTPESTTPISAGQPVRAVLELRGGTADRQGINPGDRVIYPAFAP